MQDSRIQERQRRRRLKMYLPKLPGDVLKITVLLIFAFPFYWMLITAFKTYNESIIVPPTLWPRHFTIESFQTISQLGAGLMRYALNSVIITASIVTLQLVVMVPAAYAFARRRFPLRGFLLDRKSVV